MPDPLAVVRDNAITSAEASRLLDDFEQSIDDLRVAYEKYFLGIDRRAPAQRHRSVKAEMQRLVQLHLRSTALRFRLNGLRARLVTYQHYWNRVLSQIEKGTYRRDIAQRVARRSATPDVPEPTPREHTQPMDVVPPQGPGKAAPRPPPPPVPGMKVKDVHQLFDRLVAAKRAAGEDTRGLTVKALARKLSRELPKLQKKHGGGVKFEVATVRGKVTLRARAPSPKA